MKILFPRGLRKEQSLSQSQKRKTSSHFSAVLFTRRRVQRQALDRLTEAELRPIFTSLYFLDMETFFYHENKRYPPSLSQFGKLRSVLKSDLLYHVLKRSRMFNQKITHLLRSFYLTGQLSFACSSLWHQKMLKSAVERLLSQK